MPDGSSSAGVASNNAAPLDPVAELSRAGQALQARGIEELQRRGVLPDGSSSAGVASNNAAPLDPAAELSRAGQELQARGIEELQRRGILPSSSSNAVNGSTDSPAPLASQATEQVRSFLTPFDVNRSTNSTSGSPVGRGEIRWLDGRAKLTERPSFLTRPPAPQTNVAP